MAKFKKLILSMMSVVFIYYGLYAQDQDGISDFLISRDIHEVIRILEKNAKVIRRCSDTEMLIDVLEPDEHIESFDEIGDVIVGTNHYIENFLLINKIPLAMSLLQNKMFDNYSTLFFKDSDCMKVLRKDGKVLGLCVYGCNPHEEFSWYIRMLIIDEPYRRQGYGTTLLQACTEYMVASGADKVLVHMGNYNTDSMIPFYKKHGFYPLSENLLANGSLIVFKRLDDDSVEQKFNPQLACQNLKYAYSSSNFQLKCAMLFEQYFDEMNNLYNQNSNCIIQGIGRISLCAKYLYRLREEVKNSDYDDDLFLREIENLQNRLIDSGYYKSDFNQDEIDSFWMDPRSFSIVIDEAFIARRNFKLKAMKQYLILASGI